MYRVMMVEDDPVICKALCEHLRKWGFEVAAIENFQAVTEQIIRYEPHLVLMDITLPYFNGFHWCTELRRVSSVPVVFLSSASDNMNIVMAVNMGGDDFIAKPFDLDVLTAKLQALLRRTYAFQGQSALIEHAGAVLSLGEAALIVNDERVELTKNEYRILKTLMEHPQQVVTREQLIERLWQSDSFIDDNTLTVNVTRLRKKLEDAGLVGFITTKKGMGYMVS